MDCGTMRLVSGRGQVAFCCCPLHSLLNLKTIAPSLGRSSKRTTA